MRKPIVITMAIVLIVLAIMDAYLLTASINACTVHAPINLIAIFATGIPLIEGRFSIDTPEWVVLVCANALSLCVYLPVVIMSVACVRWLKKRKRKVEQKLSPDPADQEK